MFYCSKWQRRFIRTEEFDSQIYKRSNNRTFNNEAVFKILNKNKILSIALSELRQVGWSEMKLDPDDVRKRIYKLDCHGQLVIEMVQK